MHVAVEIATAAAARSPPSASGLSDDTRCRTHASIRSGAAVGRSAVSAPEGAYGSWHSPYVGQDFMELVVVPITLQEPPGTGRRL
jgi:hypothetical protein